MNMHVNGRLSELAVDCLLNMIGGGETMLPELDVTNGQLLPNPELAEIE